MRARRPGSPIFHLAGLAIGLTALIPLTPALSVDHATRLDHRSGPDIRRAAAFGPFADARNAGDGIVGRLRFGM